MDDSIRHCERSVAIPNFFFSSPLAGENVGSYTISATLSPSGVLGNYNITYNTATFTINYGFKGLLQPYAAPPSDFNTGRSIPLKWQYTDSSGNVVNSSTAAPSVTITLGGKLYSSDFFCSAPVFTLANSVRA